MFQTGYYQWITNDPVIQLLLVVCVAAVCFYLFIVTTWVLYLAIMNLAAHRDRMGPVARFHANIVYVVGLVYDAILNLLFCAFVFRQVPHYSRLLLTATLQHNIRVVGGWRGERAMWICEELLNPFDPSGRHC